MMCFSMDTLTNKYGSPPSVTDSPVFFTNCDFFLVIPEFNFLQMHVCPIRVKMAAPVPVATQQILNAVVLQIILVILVKQIKVKITGLWISKSSGFDNVRHGAWRVTHAAWRVVSGASCVVRGAWPV